MAANKFFTSAAEIVRKVMLNEGIPMSTEPLEALQKPDYTERAANRFRQKMCPVNPHNLDFEID
jgi:mannitol-1-phosphate/altronate dehydrogenase